MSAALTPAEKKAAILAKQVEKEQAPVGQSKEEGTPVRRKKGSFGGLNKKLDVDHHIEGYHLHWLNDSPGRIPGALESGYEHVKEKEVYSYSKSEEFVKRHVGTSERGDSMTAYLMKIRQDWYEEDQQRIEDQNMAFDNTIRQGKLDSPSNGYVPSTGIKMNTSNNF